MFQWEWFVYQMMGASFLSGGRPMGGIGFGGRGGGFEKNCKMDGAPPPHAPQTMGNPGTQHSLNSLATNQITKTWVLCYFMLWLP